MSRFYCTVCFPLLAAGLQCAGSDPEGRSVSGETRPPQAGAGSPVRTWSLVHCQMKHSVQSQGIGAHWRHCNINNMQIFADNVIFVFMPYLCSLAVLQNSWNKCSTNTNDWELYVFSELREGFNSVDSGDMGWLSSEDVCGFGSLLKQVLNARH